MQLSHVPLRAITGAFILNSGLTKLKGGQETAEGVHGFATAAYPEFKRLRPEQFTKLLASGEIALTCDLLVAAKGAKLGIPEAGVGLFAAGGGLLRLPQRLPLGVALEMALTADPITAEDAFGYGLVTRLAEPGQAVDVALALAERIARNAPLSVAASKRLIRASIGRSEAEFWELQKPEIPGVFQSDDAREGPRAFAEKRAPNWSGR